jgi:hypothetical protein
MSFNGNGTFNIDTNGQPVVDGTLIEADVFNDLTADIAAGLTNCITKDGQTTPTANIPMGGQRITGLGLGTSSTDAARVDNANSLATCEFRMSPVSGFAVTTTDDTSSTVYVVPYKGNRIMLYDGTNWVMRTSGQISIVVPSTTATMYDLFAYDSSGSVALEATAWTNDTTRATALTTQNGVLVKTGALTRRYLGSFRTNSVSGQTEDSKARRFVWNYYNRVLRDMRVLEATDSWNYTTATIRQANNSTANQLDFIVGYNEDVVYAEIAALVSNSTANVDVAVGIGLDSTTAFTSGGLIGYENIGVASVYRNLRASLRVNPGVGRHYLSWNEYSAATGTSTWYGDNGAATLRQAGITGEIWS